VSTVFISYRRGDSAGHTGRLLDSLDNRFGTEAFFRDLESLEIGGDFPAELEKALAGCSVVLVMIGPGWLTAQSGGVRRLDQQGDFVRQEVAGALARKDVRTIPVLVGGATVPSSSDLPEELRPLASRNAIEISDSRWDYDVGRLADALVRTAGLKDLHAQQATSTGSASNVALAPNKRASLLGKAGLLVLGGAGTVLALLGLDAWLTAPEIALATFDHEGLTWTTDTTATNLDWNGANAHCSALGEGWRLPTIEELRTVADPNNPNETGTKILKPFHAEIGSNWIWSSDPDADDAAKRLAFDFEELKPTSLAIDFNKGAQALCVWFW
jgi:Protein of unknown function (DUF1566)/TIR domain